MLLQVYPPLSDNCQGTHLPGTPNLFDPGLWMVTAERGSRDAGTEPGFPVSRECLSLSIRPSGFFQHTPITSRMEPTGKRLPRISIQRDRICRNKK